MHNIKETCASLHDNFFGMHFNSVSNASLQLGDWEHNATSLFFTFTQFREKLEYVTQILSFIKTGRRHRAKSFWIIWHEADAAEQVQDHNLVCVEWLSYLVRKFTRLLESKTWCSKIWESLAKHFFLHDRISSNTLNALSSIWLPFTVSVRHDVLLKHHNTHVLVMCLMGTSPKDRFHMLHQSNPDCRRRLAARFLEPNRPYEPWPLNAHHIVFLHLFGGILSMSDNLNKCCVLASPGMACINFKICAM